MQTARLPVSLNNVLSLLLLKLLTKPSFNIVMASLHMNGYHGDVQRCSLSTYDRQCNCSRLISVHNYSQRGNGFTLW